MESRDPGSHLARAVSSADHFVNSPRRAFPVAATNAAHGRDFVSRTHLRKPALAVPGRLASGDACIRPLRVARLLLNAGPMSERDLVHGVAAPVSARLVLTRANGEDGTRRVSGADDDVLRLDGTMDEVPLPQRPLLTLD